MANSDFLRGNKNQHSVKNSKSKKMDKDIDKSILTIVDTLMKEYQSNSRAKLVETHIATRIRSTLCHWTRVLLAQMVVSQQIESELSLVRSTPSTMTSEN
jgi:hypothetical protein